MFSTQIRPVTDLRNRYSDVENDLIKGPVVLTKNGTGRYVLIDIADYNSFESAMKLNMELMRGRISGERDGWINKSEMRAHFMEKANA